MMLYVAQLLLLMIFVALFKDTTLFNPRAFAIALVVATVVWMAAQARAHMKAKILYVDPDSESRVREDGARVVRGRGRDKGMQDLLLSSGANCGIAGAGI